LNAERDALILKVSTLDTISLQVLTELKWKLCILSSHRKSTYHYMLNYGRRMRYILHA